jgi:hypothetical protein
MLNLASHNIYFFFVTPMKLHGCRIERLELFDEFEEWHMMQVSS